MSTSSRGSAMPEPVASAFRCSGFPTWVLIDTTALIGRCDNETTARGTTRDGSLIEVSFMVVDPPALSRCVVYCPDLPTSNSASPASVTGADGAFLLVRVFFPQRDGKRHFSDVFVYRAGSPSLLRIPEPYPVYFLSSCVGLLTCGDAREHCLAVVPAQRFDADGKMRYDLRVFSTMTKLWSTKVARVPFESEMHYGVFEPSKVFSIGGVSLAWVDMRYGILLCKQVEKDPVMRLIELPALLPTNLAHFGLRSDGCGPPLDRIRDVTFSNGWFRFVEMEFVDRSISPSGWRVTVFKRNTESENWKQSHSVDTRISPAESCCPYLFPEFYNDQENLLTLNKLISSFPLLDEYNKNVIYMISRVDAGDTYGWILAINVKDRKLEKAVPFSVKRLFARRFYLQCSFSSYFDKDPGTHLTIELETCTNREKIELLESSLMSALNHLRNIEIHMESVKQRYNECSLLLCDGPPSSLDRKYNGMPLFYPSLISFPNPNIRTGMKYDLNDGREKNVAHARDDLLRIRGDVELQISAPIDAVKNKIRVARGALYNLVRALPPNVLDA